MSRRPAPTRQRGPVDCPRSFDRQRRRLGEDYGVRRDLVPAERGGAGRGSAAPGDRPGEAGVRGRRREGLPSRHPELAADTLAKNLTLTAEQAAKFWPVFEQYQKEQNVIMDVLPTRLAVRAIQIDRRLSLATQMELATQIPLVH
jgi:hypothetical protein